MRNFRLTAITLACLTATYGLDAFSASCANLPNNKLLCQTLNQVKKKYCKGPALSCREEYERGDKTRNRSTDKLKDELTAMKVKIGLGFNCLTARVIQSKVFEEYKMADDGENGGHALSERDMAISIKKCLEAERVYKAVLMSRPNANMTAEMKEDSNLMEEKTDAEETLDVSDFDNKEQIKREVNQRLQELLR